MENAIPVLLTISILIVLLVPLFWALMVGLVGNAFAGWHGFLSLAWRTYLIALGICVGGLGLIWGIGALGFWIYGLLT